MGRMAKTKPTEEMVEQAIRLKADGLSNGDIICALGIHESTFYWWIGNPRGKLQRALCEGLKKEANFKQTLLTTIRAAALARNRYWTAAAWLLERKYPDEYGKTENALAPALVDVCRAVMACSRSFGAGLPEEDEVSVVWDDSIVQDTEAEKAQDIHEVTAGIKGAHEYRMHWFGEDEVMARRNATGLGPGAGAREAAAGA